MNLPYVGQIVYHFNQADRRNGAVAAIVTQANQGAVDLMLFPVNSSAPRIKQGVRHMSDPCHVAEPRPSHSLTEGGYDFIPDVPEAHDMRTVVSVVVKLAERLDRLEAAIKEAAAGPEYPPSEAKTATVPFRTASELLPEEVSKILVMWDGLKNVEKVRRKMGPRWKTGVIEEVLHKHGKLEAAT